MLYDGISKYIAYIHIYILCITQYTYTHDDDNGDPNI